MFELPAAIKGVLDSYKVYAQTGSVKGAIESARALLKNLVGAALDLDETGAAKKSLVLTAFGDFYDNVIAVIPIPYVPVYFSKKFFAKVRPIAMELASSAIEDFYQLLLVKIGK